MSRERPSCEAERLFYASGLADSPRPRRVRAELVFSSECIGDKRVGTVLERLRDVASAAARSAWLLSDRYAQLARDLEGKWLW